MKQYSQFGQDSYLYEAYFKNKQRGIFVDIGAHDGLTGSNTFLFESIGWEGICFEPIPEVFEQLQKNRKCILKNIAISDKTGIAEFRKIKGHSEMLSGLVSEYSNSHLSRIEREMKEYTQSEEIIQVQTSTFDESVPWTKINIVSIDVEGAESSIIKNINFNKYSIQFLVVEFNEGSDLSLIDYVLSKGFIMECRMGVDLIFKNKSYE